MFQRTLLWILDQARAEAKLALNAGLSQNIRTHLIRVANRVQTDIWMNYRWPVLRGEFSVATSAGQRYYDLPATAGDMGVFDVYARWSDSSLRVPRGIDPHIRNGIDPALDQRSDPPQRWDYFGVQQIEIWPLPATASTITVRGIDSVTELVDDDDMSTLDAYLIALYVAAEATTDEKWARFKLQQADARLARLKAQFRPSGAQSFILGGPLDAPPRDPPRGTPWVAVDRGT